MPAVVRMATAEHKKRTDRTARSYASWARRERTRDKASPDVESGTRNSELLGGPLPVKTFLDPGQRGNRTL